MYFIFRPNLVPKVKSMRLQDVSRHLVNAGLLSIVLLVAYDCYSSLTAPGLVRDPQNNMKFLSASIAFGSVVLWPVLFDMAVSYRTATSTVFVFIGFIWPIVMGYLDIQAADEKSIIDVLDDKHEFRIGTFRADISVIVSAAFAIATLLTSQFEVSVSRASSPLILYGILLCLVFLSPPSDNANGVNFNQTVAMQAAQKVCLNYAVGFVITGIAIGMANGSKSRISAVMSSTKSK